ncbi:Methyltransferase domain-containing protein [Marinobacter daqiaonensis]|uniref:Methyltransferase domain-containing protein n=1 Tax=Marinobacter daqiaonensis TaxID=650891 RepID=A0A1I6HGB6_9GAMM|nr:methyltransferase domain-containing protein [Marinobacter daqiaonensis]SFR53471.1 Methyltransferase domain-containing protein [Marinobacter daqiaonensis]
MLTPSISGDVVFHTRDRLGPIMVIDHRRHRVLSFDSVFEQSKIDRRRPWLPVHEYNRAMLLPLAWQTPVHATVLGVGGGTLVSAIHHLLPGCRLLAVDLREAVLQVAREFFSLPESSRVETRVNDARRALEELPPGSTDLILADLYSADRMSPAQSRRHFMDLCLRALSDDGWLVLNYHRPPDRDSRLIRYLASRFATLMAFTSKTNNTVLYASRQPVAPMDPKSPRLNDLEQALPVAWPKLMAKVERIT